MYDVITIGAATRDVFLLSDHFHVAKDKHLSSFGEVLYFNLGSKNELKEVILTTGGGATNAAVTFARQGLTTACICRVGDEESGHENKGHESGYDQQTFELVAINGFVRYRVVGNS